MNRDIGMQGMAELAAVLTAFPKNLQNNAVRGGLRAGAKPIRDLARSLAPKESGELASGINSSDPRRNEDGVYTVQIRVGGRHGFLGVMKEWGTAPHFISAGDSDLSPRQLTRAAKADSIDVVSRKGGRGEAEVLKIGDNYITGAIHHPGEHAHPFMRPALDGGADAAAQAFATYVAGYIQNKSGFTPTGMAA